MARILVIEDDEHHRLLLEEELACEGHATFSAGRGDDAINLLAFAAPDLIILDIGIPNVDGLRFLGKLVARRPRVPVVIYTAYQPCHENFMSWAADAYVLKHSDLGQLKSAVRQVLETSLAACPPAAAAASARADPRSVGEAYRRGQALSSRGAAG